MIKIELTGKCVMCPWVELDCEYYNISYSRFTQARCKHEELCNHLETYLKIKAEEADNRQ